VCGPWQSSPCRGNWMTLHAFSYTSHLGLWHSQKDDFPLPVTSPYFPIPRIRR
jgi:hypothetical protein